MKRLACGLVLIASLPVSAQSIQGRWKLIAAEDLRADGTVARYPWGRHPAGAIVVEGGACYVQIMSGDVPSFGAAATPANEQMKAALLSTYIAYSGPCTVNDGEGRVTLKVEAAWRPDYVGTEQTRFFRFENGRMLFGPAPNSMRAGGESLTRRLTLERVNPDVHMEGASFRTSDGWTIHADLYGSGDRGVVLIHGGRLTKESWSPQAQVLAQAGFRVLAIDLRGYGASKAGPAALNPGFGSPLDALAAVRFLRTLGAKTVSIVGGSMGADAAAGASVEAMPGEIDRLVLLAGSADQPAEKLRGRKLFVVTREDANAAGPRLPAIQSQYDRAAQPKELLILDGTAHAQFMFETPQGDRLMREILRFLSAP